MSKRAVVTGASRHLGFHVAQAALQAGFEVELLITSRNTNVERLLAAGAHFTLVNFDERTSFRRQLEWADVLYHVATPDAIPRNAGPSSGEATRSSEQVLNAAVAAEVPGIVVTNSAAAVYGRNADPQRLLSEQDRPDFTADLRNGEDLNTEQICDRLIRDHGADIRRLYACWVFGPADTRGSLPQKLVRNYLTRGQRFWFKGGLSINAVEEVGQAHVAAALNGDRCCTYVLGGENLSFRQFYSQLAALSGRPAPRVRLPACLASGSGRVWGALQQRANDESGVDPLAAARLAGTYGWYDSSKAVRELDYKIRPAEEVLEAGILMERKRAAGTTALFYRTGARQVSRASERWTDGTILLTGVPGWLGNRFIDVLMNGDRTGFRYPARRVHVLVQAHHAPLLDLPECFRVFTADLTRRSDLSQALAGVQTVVHLHETRNPRRLETLEKVNTEATKNLADECIRAGVRRFLYLSTDAVCRANGERIFDEHTRPDPVDEYGRSKWLAEEYLLEKQRAGELDVTILREFWVFGPFAPARQEQYFAALRRPRQVVLGNGHNLRSVSHVDNTVSALLAAELAPASVGKAYWIGDAKCDYTLDEINALLCEALGWPYRPVYLPAKACAAARVADRLLNRLGELNSSLHEIANSDRDRAGRTDAAQRDFGYRPIISFPEYVNEIARRGRPESATKKAYAGLL